jgi:hypothetical protein
MKKVVTLLCGSLTLLIASAVVAQGQANDKFIKKPLKQYWTDKQSQPWNDLTYQMAVRLDPQYAQSLNTTEISTDDGSLKYNLGEWRYFSLKRDGAGTYADVDYLVYENSGDPVTYQIELHKNGVAAPFIVGGSSKQEVRNTSVSKPIALKEVNTLLLKDWLIIAGAILAGAILIYVMVFRWLFAGLLRRRWGVSSAEHFTWSLSLLGMLAVASALTLLYMGPRLETWIIMGIMGAFWLLHAVVWLVSGKEA